MKSQNLLRMFSTFAFAAFLIARSASAVFADQPFENMLIVNEDNSHFYMAQPPEKMTLEGLNEFVDFYAGTKTTHLFLSTNSSRANVLNPAREAIWQPNVEGVEPTNQWATNCKLLHERGLDPYKVWIARCREKGISPWLSMRMNDLHGADDITSYMHSYFWAKNPQFWRVPNTESKNWFMRALNFKHPEVRKHATDFIDFLFQEYDFDGLELDWMRFGRHLTPGHEEEEGAYLTEVVEYARKLADRRSKELGRKVYLAVRAPACPDAAKGLGIDAVAWAKSGLVDLIVPCPFWSTADFDIPVETWNELLEGTGVAIAPCLETRVHADPSASASSCTIPQLYGFAAAEQSRGTSNIYLFNWMIPYWDAKATVAYRQMLNDGFAPDFLRTVDREVPTTYRDMIPDDFPNEAQTPQEADRTKAAVFHIATGPAPSAEEGSGIAVGFSEREGLANATFTATLNGYESERCADLDAQLPDAKRSIFFAFPKKAFERGKVEFSIKANDENPQRIVFVAARLKGAK